MQCPEPAACVPGKYSSDGKNGGGAKACQACSPGKFSPTAGAFITQYTSFILPSVHAHGSGHWLGTYVCISVSISMHASLISLASTTLYSRFWALSW